MKAGNIVMETMFEFSGDDSINKANNLKNSIVSYFNK